MCQGCRTDHRTEQIYIYKDTLPGPLPSSLLDNLVTTRKCEIARSRASAGFEGDLAYKDFPQNPPKKPPLKDRLSRISKADKPWDKYRDVADILETVMAAHDGKMLKRAARMDKCGDEIAFAVIDEDGVKRWKLHRASFCRVRGCPICAWRRSLLWTGRILNAWPDIISAIPDCQAIMLTLTQRNCSIADFREEFQRVGKGWNAMNRRVAFKRAVRGWLRNTEVTQGRDGESCHLHNHVLLLVDKRYFQRGTYLSRAEWQKMWMDCLGLDYLPQVDVRKLQACESDPVSDSGVRIPKKALLEITKYSTKVADIERDPEWYVRLLEQSQGLRFVSSGGVLKNILSKKPQQAEEEPEEDELLHLDAEERGGEIEEIHTFAFWHVNRWCRRTKRRGFYYRTAVERSPLIDDP